MSDILIKLLANRLFVILTLLGMVGLTIFSIYFFFIQKRETPPSEEVPLAKEEEVSPTPTPEEITPSPLPAESPTEPAFGEVGILSSRQISDPWISADGKLVKYLSKSEGVVYELDIKTKKEEKFISFTPNLTKILWSPNGFHLINIFRQNGETNKYSYNSFTGENILLNKNFKFISWSPEGEKIAYHYFNPENEEGFISIAEPDGRNWKNLTPVLKKDLKVEWPQKNKISFYNLFASSQESSDLNVIDPESGTSSRKIISSKYGLKINWSPSGSKLLFSGHIPGLTILDEALEIKNLEIPSWADKCVWSKTEKHIFCGLPQNLTQEIKLPEDWDSEKFISQDLLFKINLESDEKTQITREAKYDISELFLAPDESYLYFVDKRNNLLHSVKL